MIVNDWIEFLIAIIHDFYRRIARESVNTGSTIFIKLSLIIMSRTNICEDISGPRVEETGERRLD